jgi:hypothetical protein
VAKLSNLFPSNYLSAGDLPDEGLDVTIVSMDQQKMPDGAEKSVIYFKEWEKGMVLNKVNAKSIAALYGDETDDWEEKRITIWPTETPFNGDMVPCIRVKKKAPKPAGKKTVAPGVVGKSGKITPMTQAEVDDMDEEDDDKLPF